MDADVERNGSTKQNETEMMIKCGTDVGIKCGTERIWGQNADIGITKLNFVFDQSEYLFIIMVAANHIMQHCFSQGKTRKFIHKHRVVNNDLKESVFSITKLRPIQQNKAYIFLTIYPWIYHFMAWLKNYWHSNLR